MMKLLTLILSCSLGLGLSLAQTKKMSQRVQKNIQTSPKSVAKDIYAFTALTNKGEEFSFANLKGKVLLIVNTASKCGLTSQYEALEKLYVQYADRGLLVIGFPCDQFGNQEPGSDAEIEEFCKLNYGVTFPLMKKIEVNGEHAHPIYKYLKSTAGGWFGDAIKWNFTKFLISRDGRKIERYAPITKPESIVADIETFWAE